MFDYVDACEEYDRQLDAYLFSEAPAEARCSDFKVCESRWDAEDAAARGG